jgi:hypothetical protein
MPDKSFIGNTSGYKEDKVLDYVVAHNLWLQDNGLTATSSFKSDQWNKVPHMEEQRQETSQSGDSLLADLQNALKLGGNYILVFPNDIENSANQATLQQIAALANTSPATPTVTPTNTPTATTTPGTTPTATSTPPPASYRYSFEDGTTDQWSLNHADSLTNSTSYAFDGTHSLKLVVKSVTADGYANASINASATGSPAMPVVGQTVSAQVYLPGGAPPVKAVVFVKDSAGTKFYTSYDQVSNLPTGQWTQLQFTVPATISGTVAEYGVRFQFPAKSSSSLNAYIDAVNW